MKLHHLLLGSILAASSVSFLVASDIDTRIVDAAKASYNYRTVLEDKVTVKSNDRVVTLTGMVADKDLKNLAEDTVNNLPGVLRVDNQIVLDPSLQEHSDAWIAWKIRYQLLVRANVSNRNTKVDAKDGIVTLTGSASSLAEKELAGVYAAEIEGVKSVRNELAIDIPASDERSVAETIDDASITSQVKYALMTHKSTSALKTKVSTKDGIVVLSGVARNDAEKSLAGKLASSIRGVKSVTNEMTIKS